MAYQFAHMEIHSRKGGKSGSVSYVLDEAERLEGACSHVSEPAPAELVFGIPLSELRAEHEARSAAACVTLKNGQTRKVRQDQNTMMSVVVSFPQHVGSADPAALREWEERSVAWLRQELGPGLKSVVRHVDEAHPHLHAYALDEGLEMRVATLHPGAAAKTAAMAAGGDNKEGDRAYRQAMRQWQDRYWNDVGMPCGLARLGPGRRRLTRKAWKDEKDAYGAVREARTEAKRLQEGGRAYIERTKAKAAAIASTAKVEADIAERQRRIFETIGGRIGVLWAKARSIVTGHDRKIEVRIREEEAAQQRVLEAKVAAAETSLRDERRKGREMKTSLDVTSADLRTARSELLALQRLQAGNRPGRDSSFNRTNG
jgi:hypothetical protein